jgi:hypothetical protein
MKKCKYQLPDERIVSCLVLNDKEYDDLCTKILDLRNPVTMARVATPTGVQQIRQDKHIPILLRGPLTEPLFKDLEVDTELLSVIVEGHGQKILERSAEEDGFEFLGGTEEEFSKKWDKLPGPIQAEIKLLRIKLCQRAHEKASLGTLLSNFIQKHGKQMARRLRIEYMEQTQDSVDQTLLNMQTTSTNWEEEFGKYLIEVLTFLYWNLQR